MSKIVTVIKALSKNEKALKVLDNHCDFDLVSMVNGNYNELTDNQKKKLREKLIEFGLLDKEEEEKKKAESSRKDNKPSYYYNYEFKMDYLDNHTDYQEETKRVFRVFFRQIAEIEKELKKDFYDFNTMEIERALKHLKSTTVRSLQNTASLLSKYVDFAIKNKISVMKENVMHNFSTQDKLEKLIDEEASERMYFTKKEVMDMAMFAENAQDGVILALLYDGFSHKNNFHELVNLKVEDIDFDRKVALVRSRGEYLNLSSETVHLLKAAISVETYHSIKGDKGREYHITETDYVLRPLRNKGNTPISWRNINQRILRISEFNERDLLNATNIVVSGQINFAYNAYMKDKTLGDEAIRMALRNHNQPVNKSALFALKKKIQKYTGTYIAS